MNLVTAFKKISGELPVLEGIKIKANKLRVLIRYLAQRQTGLNGFQIERCLQFNYRCSSILSLSLTHVENDNKKLLKKMLDASPIINF